MTTPHNPQPPTIGRTMATNQLCRSALADIERRYGSTKRTGEIWLPYHNASHGKQVHDFSLQIARVLRAQGKVSSEDIDAIRIAAAHHDHEQLLGSGHNEIKSAQIAVKALAQYKNTFGSDDKQKVAAMIEGTITSLTPDGRLAQKASKMGLLEAIVADGDLAVLGTPIGPRMALNLFLEQQSMEGKIKLPHTSRELAQLKPDPAALAGFYQFQDRLLANHQYILEESHQLFGPGLERHREVNGKLMRANELGAPFSAQIEIASTFAKDFDFNFGVNR